MRILRLQPWKALKVCFTPADFNSRLHSEKISFHPDDHRPRQQLSCGGNSCGALKHVPRFVGYCDRAGLQ